MRRKGNEPVDFTCPLIDEVISFIDEIENFLIEIQSIEINDEISLDAKVLQNKISDVSIGHTSFLEKIRSANDELRVWGNEQFDSVVNLEKDLTYNENKVKELESEIYDYKEENQNLQTYINELETQSNNC